MNLNNWYLETSWLIQMVRGEGGAAGSQEPRTGMLLSSCTAQEPVLWWRDLAQTVNDEGLISIYLPFCLKVLEIRRWLLPTSIALWAFLVSFGFISMLWSIGCAFQNVFQHSSYHTLCLAKEKNNGISCCNRISTLGYSISNCRFV